MAEIMDRRPVCTLVMGCNGAGKSAWKRANYDRLPRQYFDQDSIAGGIGDWNDEEARQRTRRIVDAEIESCFTQRESFGIESTFSGRPGPAMMARATASGYRIEGYYIGTESWEVNASRIDYRVLSNTGHYVDPKQLPQRYRWSLSNLRTRLHDFDLIEVVDNTEESIDRIPAPVVQFVAEKGVITEQLPARELAGWSKELLRRLELDRRREQAREEARRRSATTWGR